ncbi:NAD(P)H-dependent oxidoreductase [Roseisalinus antarcticus]|uniref:General stress protein 14 n=1 Tax=Roseisalinus antarcticus TaxID=254357 RepID=A0A1Y5RQR1_9RHOB|nr:NAD(P)H-dependent oxidoreductase [Roseisalinus antarcticus]SLN22787.1 General stress protein 14 [Roseisalinus antarcticus]
MARVLLYYAHPGNRFSKANTALLTAARSVDDIDIVDLYAEYPRFDINVDREQERLLAHDVIVLQFPLFWYSAPALVKEWIDLVLEHGFAYGEGGEALSGKTMMLALTAAGPEDAYAPDGYQRHELRTFLTPFERTAGLCSMTFPAPYVLYGSLKAAEAGALGPHVDGYVRLLSALRDDRYDLGKTEGVAVHDRLPIREGAPT